MFKILSLALCGGIAAMAATPTPGSDVTFNKDVLPILQKNCQTCHRPGEVAPMSLLTYESARPWAKAIKAAVLSKKMPPWFADPKFGHFKNQPALTEADIATLAAWADTGAAEGNPKDAPAPLVFQEGWNIKPDIIVEMPKDIPIQATGIIDYQYVVVHTNFPQDLWVTAAEVRPGNRQVVHHMRALVRPPDSHYVELAEEGIATPIEKANPKAKPGERLNMYSEMVARYNPGLTAQEFTDDDAAKFVPKGSDIVFQCHYTTIGKATTDRSKLGLVLAKNPPAHRYYTSETLNDAAFTIQPGDAHSQSKYEVTVLQDVDLVWMQSHMHLRGKKQEIDAIYPTGEKEVLLKTDFDFNWQLGYELDKPKLIPKGTRLILLSEWDNSANNPYNPDATAQVKFGFQTMEEMSTGFLGVVVDRNADTTKLFSRPDRQRGSNQPATN